MQLTTTEIKALDRIKRLNLINSLSGYKTIALIGTRGKDGQENVAIFSSIVHLGSDPAMIGFVLRPQSPELTFHTYQHILDTSEYTLNLIPQYMAEQAHYTAAKFPSNVSEFDQCGFTPVYYGDCKAPFVKESPVSMGLRFLRQLPIEENGTSLIIGAIHLVQFDENGWDEEGHLLLDKLGVGALSGLNTYYKTQKTETYPYPRVEELPFKK